MQGNKESLDAGCGDPEAQSRLADRYYSSFEYATATKWYRLAAQKGNVNAQCSLGVILLNGMPAFPNKGVAVPAEPQQGLAWLLRAGGQDHAPGQIELGHCYRDGKVVPPDLCEAYKWYSLAARKSLTCKPRFLDPLILKMTPEQIAEGQKRVESFVPGVETGERLARTALTSQFVLKSGVGSSSRRMVILNNYTFEAGEEGEVRIGRSRVKVKCLAIGERSAKFEVDGEKIDLLLPN
jgi:hypothetical protein